MKRIYTSVALTILTVSGALAAPLSPEQALQRLDGNLSSVATRGIGSPVLKTTYKDISGEPSIYIFDKTDTRGFLVVSADDCTMPLLGYSDNGLYDVDNIPPALEYWLGEYTRQIEYVREQGLVYTRGVDNTRASLPAWSPISPLIQTTWDQNAPYNDMCPTLNNTRCYTGCVATSMAQVMNYFKYPAQGQGNISYQVNYGTDARPSYTTYTADFSTMTFDWDNMLNSYSGGNYTQAQADAVATLMKACGYSVQMSYSTNTSGAVSGFIPGALVNYFKYDPSATYVSRSMTPYNDWATLIYNNLKNVGPVIYDGDSATVGGHSFICDGYSSDGYFHFNWGWSGVSDGYFLLDALDPPALGIGGGGGGFDFGQDIVLNIKPNKGGSSVKPEDKVVLSGSVEGYKSSGGYLYIKTYGNSLPGFRYYGQTEITFNVGCIITQADNTNAAPIYQKTSNPMLTDVTLTPGYVIVCDGVKSQYPGFILSKLNLSDNVKYKVTIAYQPEGSTEWIPMEAGVGCYNYFYVTKKGSDYTFDNFPLMQFDCTDLKFNTQLYNGMGVDLDLSVVNKNDTQLTRGVALYLLDSKGNVTYQGESIVVTLDPGQTYKLSTWSTTLTRTASGTLTKATEFYPALYDFGTNSIYYQSQQSVTMNPNPGAPTYTLSLTIDNAEPKYDEEFQEDVYMVPTAYSFNTTTTVNVTDGIFSKTLTLYVLEATSVGESSVKFEEVMSYPLQFTIVEAGETAKIPNTIQFPTATVGNIYMLGLLVEGDKNINEDTTILFIPQSNESGVESIEISEEDIIFIHDKASSSLKVLGGVGGIETVEVYYLNGMRAPAKVDQFGGTANIDLSEVAPGIVVISAIDSKGNKKSTKVIL